VAAAVTVSRVGQLLMLRTVPLNAASSALTQQQQQQNQQNQQNQHVLAAAGRLQQWVTEASC
jgi:hypothetical protein